MTEDGFAAPYLGHAKHCKILQALITSTTGGGWLFLDESLAISTELGMRPLVERVLSRGEILKA